MRKRRSNKIVVGVTGGFGSGKSTVAGLFKDLGARVVDADRIAHSLLRPGTPQHARIISLFGKNVVSSGSAIDRKKLARAVFGNRENLKKLNNIIHPGVIERIKKQVARSKNTIIVIDAPLLFESGLDTITDRVITVYASLRNQIRRMKKKMSLGESEIVSRIRVQMPLSKKIALSDYCVDNDNSLTYTKKQVKTMWEEIVYEDRK